MSRSIRSVVADGAPVPAQTRGKSVWLPAGATLCVFGALAFAAVPAGGPVEETQPLGIAASDFDPSDVTGSIPESVVYIQASDMDGRFEAEGLWAALNEAGIRTPGIELTGRPGPSTAEVRYFHDGDRKLADRVAAIANANGLQNVRVRAGSSTTARHGQIELRYPG